MPSSPVQPEMSLIEGGIMETETEQRAMNKNETNFHAIKEGMLIRACKGSDGKEGERDSIENIY